MQLRINRRKFIKGTVGTAVMLPVLNRKLAAMAASDLQPGQKCLLRFAQISDTHIGDVGHPARDQAIGGIFSFFYERPQDVWGPRILDATIRSINERDLEQKLDFCIATGDLIDMSMRTEIDWFVRIADGDQGLAMSAPMLPLTPEGFKVPWYACLGNHDVLLFGSFGGSIVEKIIENDVEEYGVEMIRTPQWIGRVRESGNELGLDNQNSANDGYYSFVSGGSVLNIVLNTTTDNWLEGMFGEFQAENRRRIGRIKRWSVSDAMAERRIRYEYGRWLKRKGFASVAGSKSDPLVSIGDSGTLDQAQHEWLVQQIEGNPDKLILIYSHHASCNFSELHGNLSGPQLDATLSQYDNVIAHICGHSHCNRIETVGQYYRIRTSSLIEAPQEWREIEIILNGDSTGILRCRMHQHGLSEALEVASNHWRAAGSLAVNSGSDDDREVDLPFVIPGPVLENLL